MLCWRACTHALSSRSAPYTDHQVVTGPEHLCQDAGRHIAETNKTIFRPILILLFHKDYFCTFYLRVCCDHSSSPLMYSPVLWSGAALQPILQLGIISDQQDRIFPLMLCLFGSGPNRQTAPVQH